MISAVDTTPTPSALAEFVWGALLEKARLEIHSAPGSDTVWFLEDGRWFGLKVDSVGSQPAEECSHEECEDVAWPDSLYCDSHQPKPEPHPLDNEPF